MDTSIQQNKDGFLSRLSHAKSLCGWLIGSALTYGVMYGLSALFGISFYIVAAIYIVTVFTSQFIDSITDK